MNIDNLDYLQKGLYYGGFGENTTLQQQLEDQIRKGVPAFELPYEHSFDEFSNLEATLFFSRGKNSDMYFWNKYHARLNYFDYPEHNREQTFYVPRRGNPMTVKEGFNLLQGRSVNKDITDEDGEKYNAWKKLRFDSRTEKGNYREHTFRLKYGYSLEKELARHPIVERNNEEELAKVVKSLKKGNIHPVYFDTGGASQKMYIQAEPQFKNIVVFTVADRKNGLHLPFKRDQSKGQQNRTDSTPVEGAQDEGEGNRQLTGNGQTQHGLSALFDEWEKGGILNQNSELPPKELHQLGKEYGELNKTGEDDLEKKKRNRSKKHG